MTLITRKTDFKEIDKLLNLFPVVALLGARQCGKTTLARQIEYNHYFDLENPRDLVKLEEPLLALEALEGLIIIDEIQRKPDLFPLLRYLVDNIPNQKYLLLGSASRNLLRQSSESLAGRIAYYYLDGFRIHDIDNKNIRRLWIRGGFPRSFTADTSEESVLWRENYIATFLERDIPQLGIHIPSFTLRRFWIMLSHYHGQVINYSEIGRSFGISDMTTRKYIEILESTFMIRILQPWYLNISKRLVKRPKIYLRDSGIFHTLLSIFNMEQLMSHPKLGASWEGFALECVCKSIGKMNTNIYFWRTHTGSEIDLFWHSQGKKYGVEFKYMDAPRMTKSMIITQKDLALDHLWIVYPGDEIYELAEKVTVFPLNSIPENWIYP